MTDDFVLKKIIASFRDLGRDCWCDPGCDDTCGKRFGWQMGSLPAGYDHKYTYSHIGYNLKATDMQAAIGVEQIKKLPDFIEKRQFNFKYLSENLKKFANYFEFPRATINSEPSWFGFPILLKKDAPFARDDIIGYLEKEKIAIRMLFGGNLIYQPAYRHIKKKVPGSMENTDKVMKSLFWIGFYPGLTQPMINKILSEFQKFIGFKISNQK